MLCYPKLLKIASLFCYMVSYSIRTERLLTRQSWLKTELSLTTATVRLHRKRRMATPDLNPLDYHVWGSMLERYKTFQPKPN